MRLFWWVIALTLGAAGALRWEVSPRLIAASAPVAVAFTWWLLRARRRALAELVAAALIGAYGAARSAQTPVLPPALSALVDGEQRVEVQGWVLTAPEPARSRPGSRFRLGIESVEGKPARANLAVSVASGIPDVLPGDPVRLTARLLSVRGLANPGLPNSALQARASGIDLFAGVGPEVAVRRLEAGEIDFPRRPFTSVWRWAAQSRAALGRAIDVVVDGAPAAFLHTAVLGQRRDSDPVVEEGFRAAGATHVLSVSGLHLAAVAAALFVLVRRLVSLVPHLPLWVEPGAVAALVAVPAVAFYTLVTGNAIATVRAAIMMTVALSAFIAGRRSHALVAIATAVLALMGWSPLVLVDLSFQLSVISVLALALLAPRWARRPSDTTTKAGLMRATGRRLAIWVAGLAAVSGVAGLITAPIVAHHFGEVTPAAPLGNLLLVPLVEVVVVPFGLLGATLGVLLGEYCSWPFLQVAAQATRVALTIAEAFRHRAPIWLTRAPNVFETVSLALGFACLAARICRPAVGGGPSLRWLSRGGVILLALAGASMGARELSRRSSDQLIVTFLDIGQGDAAVVQLPGGYTVLIDGGGTYDGSFDPGARVVEPFLRARGITHLDAVALSHPHPDHMGGLHRILDRFPVDVLWTSSDDGRNPDYARLMAQAAERGIRTPVPEEWQRGPTRIEPLGPFVHTGLAEGAPRDRVGKPEGTTVNDASLVLRVSYGGRSVLFTGDIEENGEGELAGRTSVGQVVASDVLKVPHHGSRTSSSRELIDAVRPQMAVMSLGWRNRFNFPRPEVVRRYRERGIRIFRTDLDGAVTVSIDSRGAIVATCERTCR